MTEPTPEQIRAALIRLDLAVARIDQRIDSIEGALDDAAGGDPSTTAPRGSKFPNVYDWVEQWFVRVYARHKMTGVHWCPYWWEHAEAVVVLTALWRSWESMRRERDTGMVKWLTYFAYPLTRELWDGSGTFRGCSSNAHAEPPSLPYVSVPDGKRQEVFDVS